MKREELLRSPEYWKVAIQAEFVDTLHRYMMDNHMNRRELGGKLGYCPSMMTKLLSMEENHTIGTMIDISMKLGCVPLLWFVNLNTLIKLDARDMYFWITVRKKTKPTFEELNRDFNRRLNRDIKKDIREIDRVLKNNK